MTDIYKAAQMALEANGCERIKDFYAVGPVQRAAVELFAEAFRAALAEQQEPVNVGPEWTPCVKLPVTVHVRQQRPGETHVSTREGITPVKPDDLIMRGVSGEEYPIGREIFERTYRLGDAEQQEPVQPVGLTEEDRLDIWKKSSSIDGAINATASKLRKKNT